MGMDVVPRECGFEASYMCTEANRLCESGDWIFSNEGLLEDPQ